MNQRIGPYEIRGELGRGGMGVVYRGRRPDLGRDVAVKVLGHLSVEDAERFEREIGLLAGLRHPGIVTVHEAGTTEQGIPWLAMELVEGESLEDRLRAAPLAVEEAVELARQVAEALAYAHQRGVVHRDVKPANVLIGGDGRALLTDFGLARGASQERITRSGDVLGTPDYMAPEQAQGDVRRVGPAADIYALGATLYACLTGGPPFRAANLLALLHTITTAPAPRVSSARPDVDATVDGIVARCLAKEPADRFTDAGALAFALERARGGGRGPGPSRRRSGALIGAGVAGAVGVMLAVQTWRAAEPTADPVPAATTLPHPESIPEPRASAPDPLRQLRRSVARSIRVCAWAAAEEACDRALERRPNLGWALAQRGLARHCRAASPKAFARALRDLDRAVALDPASVLARRNRARARVERGDLSEGLRDLDVAVRYAPADPQLRLERAFLNARLKRRRAAQVDLEEGMRVSPGSANAVLAAALERRFANDEPGALRLVEEALQRDPSSVLALRQRATLLFRLGRFEEAVQVFDRYVEAAPGSYLAWVGRATTREKLGELQEALEDMQRAFARMRPQHPFRKRYEGEFARMRAALERR